MDCGIFGYCCYHYHYAWLNTATITQQGCRKQARPQTLPGGQVIIHTQRTEVFSQGECQHKEMQLSPQRELESLFWSKSECPCSRNIDLDYPKYHGPMLQRFCEVFITKKFFIS